MNEWDVNWVKWSFKSSKTALGLSSKLLCIYMCECLLLGEPEAFIRFLKVSRK